MSRFYPEFGCTMNDDEPEYMIPEAMKEIIKENLKRIAAGELPPHKSAIEREMTLISRAYLAGYKNGYIIAQVEKQEVKGNLAEELKNE